MPMLILSMLFSMLAYVNVEKQTDYLSYIIRSVAICTALLTFLIIVISVMEVRSI